MVMAVAIFMGVFVLVPPTALAAESTSNASSAPTITQTNADKWDGTSKSESLEGSGTEADPYLIGSAADFRYFLSKASEAAAGTVYRLTKDIDMAEGNFNSLTRDFAGVLDGNGHSVIGLHAISATADGGEDAARGIFKNFTGTLKNIAIKFSISGTAAGALIVQATGAKFSNVQVDAGVNGNLMFVAGIAFRANNCTFENTVLTGSAVTSKAGGYPIGGFATWSEGTTFTDCKNYATIGSASSRAGAFVSVVNGEVTMTNCVNYGKVTGSKTSGGLVGRVATSSTSTGIADLTIVNCVNRGSVTGPAGTGGLVGEAVNALSVDNCVNYGAVVSSDNGGTGGIVGTYSSDKLLSILNTSNHGAISATANVGGIIGTFKGTTLPNISNTSNYGAVSATANIGGLVGLVETALSISDSANYGTVKGTGTDKDDNRTGGLVGKAKAALTIYRSANYGDVSSVAALGGLVGEALAALTVDGCANYGTVVGGDGLVGTGGILGHQNGSITYAVKNTANYGAVSAVSNVGGFVGKISPSGTGKGVVKADNCANYGNLTASNLNAGGLVGFSTYSARGQTVEIYVNGFLSVGNIQAVNFAAGIAGKLGVNNDNTTTDTLVVDTAYIGGTLTVTNTSGTVCTVLGAVNKEGATINLTATNVYHDTVAKKGGTVVTPAGYTILNGASHTASEYAEGCIQNSAREALNTFASQNNLTPWVTHKNLPTPVTSLGVTGATMSLGGNMKLNLMLRASHLTGLDVASVQFKHADTGALMDAPLANGYYTASYDKRAADMASDAHILVVITLEDGTVYQSTNVLTTSPLSYLLRLYSDYTGSKKDSADAASVLDVVTNMLAYGAEAEAKMNGIAVGETKTSLAAAEAGLTLPNQFLYTDEHKGNVMTNEDIANLNSVAATGASLTGNISIHFQMKNTTYTYTTLTVNGKNTYTVNPEGSIVWEEILPAKLKDTFTLVFTGEGAPDVTAKFCVGDFLDLRRQANADGDRALAEATIRYMLSVRSYALGLGPAEPNPQETHTVTFDAAGGTGVAAQTVVKGGYAYVPTAPTRDGYTFVAWTLDGVDYDFSAPVTQDIVLVARWKSHGPYTVTYLDADGSELSSETVEMNGTATQPDDPVREGYSFIYWTWNGEEYDFSNPVTQDLTLVAYYQQDSTEPPSEGTYHAVTFQHANGTGESTVVTVTANTPVEAAKAPDYNGYIFSHWADANGNAYNFDTPVTEDMTLKAVYARDESVTIPAHTTGSIVIDPSHIEFWAGNDLALQLNIMATVTKTSAEGSISYTTTDVHFEGMDVTFYSTNPNVVAVSKDGTLTAVIMGTAYVWAVFNKGGTQVMDSTDYATYDPFVIHDGTVLFRTKVTIIEQPAYLQLHAFDPDNQQIQLEKTSTNRINASKFTAKPTGDYGSANIALWYNDAIAVLTITADDNFTGDFAQWTEWSQTYGTPVSLMAPSGGYHGNTNTWLEMNAVGNEVQPHGHHHYANTFYGSPYITTAQAWNDAYLSKVDIERATGNRALILAHPCGYNASFNKILYIAGRATPNMPNPVGLVNYNSVNIQTIPGAADFANLFDPTVTNQWAKYSYGCWLAFLEHGIIDSVRAQYEAFLPLAKERIDSGELWGTVFSAAAQYGQERDTATLTMTSIGADVLTFTLTDKMNDMLFDHALTVKIKVDSTWSDARAYQNGLECETRMVTEDGETYVYVNAVPDKGEVKVVRTALNDFTQTDDRIAFTPMDITGIQETGRTLTFEVDGTVWTHPYAVQNGALLPATITTYAGKTTLTVPVTVNGGEVVIVPVTDQYDGRDSVTMYEVWQGLIDADATRPVLISTPDDLVMFSDYVRSRGATEGITFLLTDDIDMTGVTGFRPIGWASNAPFSGIFDGAEHTISNLTIDQPYMTYVGLFGYVKGGTIKRVNVKADILGFNCVGGVVARMTKGTMDSVTFEGAVVANGEAKKDCATRVGGLAGQVDSSTVKNCSVSATVDSYASGIDSDIYVGANKPAAGNYVGGIVGQVYYAYGNTSQNSFNNIKFTGSVTGHKAYDGSGSNYVGGFSGYVAQSVMNNITIQADVEGNTYVGGFVGYFTHTNAWIHSAFTNCSAAGTATGDDYVGGFAGFADANNSLHVKNCAALVTVHASQDATHYGAVFGTNTYAEQSTQLSNVLYMDSLNPGMAAHPGTVSAVSSMASLEAMITKLNQYSTNNNLSAWRLVDDVPSATYFPVFTVTFVDKDGGVLKTESVGNTLNATPPTPPAYSGFEFTGWSASCENIQGHMTIQALYREVKIYTVTFYDMDGNVLSTQEINEGLAATAPTPPVLDRYTFDKWDVAFDNIQEDTEVRPIYKNAYYVTFVYYDANGEQVTVAVKTTEGEAAKAPAAPSTESLRFLGWDTAFDNITGDLTVTGRYTEVNASVPTKMNVLQWNLNSSLTVDFFTGSHMQNADIILYSGTSKLTDAKIPEGWAYVQADKVNSGYNGPQPAWQAVIYRTDKYTYDEAAGKYFKTPIVSGGAFPHGAVLAVPLIENSTNKQFVMTIFAASGSSAFTGVYNMNPTMKTTLKAITAQYPAAAGIVMDIMAHTGGTNIGQQSYLSGMDDAAFVSGYDLVCHYEAQTLKADSGLSADVATYLLTYMKQDQIMSINYGTVAATSGISSYNGIYSNITFGEDDQEVETYTVTFYDKEGEVLSTQEVNQGLSATAPTPPELDRYVFVEWDTNYRNIQGDTEVRPIYTDAYYVTFIYYDASGVEQTTAVKTASGVAAVAPNAPSTATLQFDAWDTAFDNVTADMTVRATYKEISQTASQLNVLQWNLNATMTSAFFTGSYMQDADIVLYTGNSKLTDAMIPEGWAYVQADSVNSGYNGPLPAWQAVIYRTAKYSFDEVAGKYFKTPLGESFPHGAVLAVPLIENSTNKQFVMTIFAASGSSAFTSVYNMDPTMKAVLKTITTQYPNAAGIVMDIMAHTGGTNIGQQSHLSSMDDAAFVSGYDLVCHSEVQTLKGSSVPSVDVATYLLTYMKDDQTVSVSVDTVDKTSGISSYNGIYSTITIGVKQDENAETQN